MRVCALRHFDPANLSAMSGQTLNLTSIGRLCQTSGIPYAMALRIIGANGIVPAVIDNGVHKYDDAGVERILAAHEAMSFVALSAKRPPPTSI